MLKNQKKLVELSELEFLDNGAVGKGDNGYFYAFTTAGDVYCQTNTRAEAVLQLSKAEK